MDKLKKYLNELHPVWKFIFRVSYPIVVFSLMYFVFKKSGGTNLQVLQLTFIFLWASFEYFIFFRK